LSDSKRDAAWRSAFGGSTNRGPPPLIEALAQPHRRSFQRGISANTVDRLTAAPTATAAEAGSSRGATAPASGAPRHACQYLYFS
jgi:hypothetical protein